MGACVDRPGPPVLHSPVCPLPAVVVDRVSKHFWLSQQRASGLKERAVAAAGRGAGGEAFWALRKCRCTIPAGTTFGIIGHNGSGKSTLLQLVAGILKPDAGAVRRMAASPRCSSSAPGSTPTSPAGRTCS